MNVYGISFGSALAIAVSYGDHHHIGWAILDGIFGWLYIAYVCIAGVHGHSL